MKEKDLKVVYDPRNFYNYTTNEERCHNGTSPTLRECIQQYGRKTTHETMRPYLDLFFGFVAAAHKPTTDQRDTICWLVMQNYGSLKMSEWLLFFTKAMAGEFGKFYNTIDPLDIMTAIREWDIRCTNIKREAKERKEQAEREEKAKSFAITEEERIANIGKIQSIILKIGRA